jgi:hypothetical protein
LCFFGGWPDAPGAARCELHLNNQCLKTERPFGGGGETKADAEIL